ncbi:unnamed protein product, partial [Brachionus calyciflorus]
MIHLICFLVVTCGLANASFLNERYERSEPESKEFMETHRPTNVSLCMFHPEFKTLNCHGPKGSVECDAFANISFVNYRVFAFSKFEHEFNASISESFKFNLYPRDLENQTYYNYSVEFDGRPIEFYLYYSSSPDFYGIRVGNFECFKRLVDIVESSSDHFNTKLFGSDSPITF